MSIINEMRAIRAKVDGIDKDVIEDEIIDAVTPSANIFTVCITADIDELTDKSKKVDAAFVFEYPNGNKKTATGNIKLQGSGSIRWHPHCNYTINKLTTELSITTYDCESAAPSLYPMARTREWGARNKFVLKADHMDHTHARNIVGARLWGDIVRSRSPKLLPVTEQPEDWDSNYNSYYRFSATSESYRLNNSPTFLPIYVYYTKTPNEYEPVSGIYYPVVERPEDWDENYESYYFNDLSLGIVHNTHSTFAVYTYKYSDPASPLDTLLTLPNCGAVDGFPCQVFINGEYCGLYDFNIPKDENLFGMSDGSTEAVLSGEEWVAATRFNTPEFAENIFEFSDGDLSLISQADYQKYLQDGTTPGKAWVVEYDEDDCSWIPTSFQQVLSVVYDYANYPDGNAFKEAFESVFDEKAAIDYLIFIRALGLQDNYGRNILMGKYSTSKWFCSAYDLDTAFGINWRGSSFFSVGNYADFNSDIYTNGFLPIITMRSRNDMLSYGMAL